MTTPMTPPKTFIEENYMTPPPMERPTNAPPRPIRPTNTFRLSDNFKLNPKELNFGKTPIYN